MNTFDNHMVCEFDPPAPALPEPDAMDSYKDQLARGLFDLAVTNARGEFGKVAVLGHYQQVLREAKGAI